MSNRFNGELRLQQKTYVVIPAEEFGHNRVEEFRKAMGIPELDTIWIGYLIRQHRVRLNLTQVELGNRTDSNQKHIDKIENGIIRRPKDLLLRKLISVLGDDFRLGLNFLGIIVAE